MPTSAQDTPKTKGKPIFIGNSALVRLVNFSDPNTSTIWLADPTNKTLRPFVSEEQFDQMFDNPQQARAAVVTLSSNELSDGGLLEDFKVLDSQYGVSNTGSMKDVEFSPAQLQDRYGKPMNVEGENKSVSALDGLLSQMGGEEQPQDPSMMSDMSQDPSMSMQPPQDPTMSPAGTGGIGSGAVYNKYSRYPYNQDRFDGVGGSYTVNTYGNPNRVLSGESTALDQIKNVAELSGGSDVSPEFVSKIKSDPGLLAFYIGALTYGNYTFGDIVTDMVRLYKIDIGDKTLDSVRLISPTITKSAYEKTEAGLRASAMANVILPSSSIMSTGSSYDQLKNYTVYNLPQNLFNGLTKTLNINGTNDATNTSYQNEIDNTKAAYYDIVSQMATAETEQEHAIARENYDTFVKEIEKQYGISLSDNSNIAWGQLDTLKNTNNQLGLAGSGLEEEQVDDYLFKVRSENQKLRDKESTDKEQKRKQYYQEEASAEEIAALSPEDRKRYSLTPDAATLNKFSVSQILADNPGISPETAKLVSEKMLDTNGNYKSTKYKNLATSVFNTSVEKEVFKRAEATKIKALEDEAARIAAGEIDESNPFNPQNNQKKDPTLTNGGLNIGDLGLNTNGVNTGEPVQTPNPVNEQTQQQTPTYDSLISSNMAFGSRGSNVTALQDFLKKEGYFPSTQDSTGYYGDVTKAAVAKYQKAKGVDTAGYEGYWGPKTISSLSTPKTQTIKPTVPTPTTPTPTPTNYGTYNGVNMNTFANNYKALTTPATTQKTTTTPAIQTTQPTIKETLSPNMQITGVPADFIARYKALTGRK